MAKRHIPYFSFYPVDFMNGVRGMSAQDVGVYTMILCRIYEENGPIEDNRLILSTYCGMRQKTFSAVIDKLISLGKFTVSDGMISNPRAMKEISKRSDDLENNSRAGKKSAEKRNENKASTPTPVERTFNHSDTDTDTYNDADDSAGARPDVTPREELLAAMKSPSMTATGRIMGNTADMAEVARWAELGLTHSQQIAVITETMSRKRDGPPSSFKYFTGAMQSAAGAMLQPKLEPSTHSPTQAPRSAPRVTFDLSQFKDTE